MKEESNLSEKSKVQLDIKALIGMVVGIVSIAGVWFTLQGEIAQLQLDVIRMQDDVELNHEFRVKWPRGEMGALPDDAKQELDEAIKSDPNHHFENAKDALVAAAEHKLPIPMKDGKLLPIEKSFKIRFDPNTRNVELVQE